MTDPIRFCLVLHNHQPIGNFDGVFEQAYQDSYLPFLDVFEGYRDLRISLHTSGPLMEWLVQHHGDYIERLANLVAAGRVEGTSARNVLPGTIETVGARDGAVEVRVLTPVPFRVLVTREAVEELGLRPAREVYLLIKAHAFLRLL